MNNNYKGIAIREDNGRVINLPVIQWKGQRIITLQDIALVHNVPLKSVQRTFANNQNKRFTPEEHYFRFEGENGRKALLDANMECRSLLEKYLGNAVRWLRIGLTESGYLRLCKILTDDTSWAVQEQLINSYFRMKEFHQNPFQMMREATDRIESMFETMQQTIYVLRSEQDALIDTQDDLNNTFENEVRSIKSTMHRLPVVNKQESEYNTLKIAIAQLQREVKALKEEKTKIAPPPENVSVIEEKKRRKWSKASREKYWAGYREHRTFKSLAEHLGILTKAGNPHQHFISGICQELGYKDGDGNMVRHQYQDADGSERFSNVVLTDKGIQGVIDYLDRIMKDYKRMTRDGVSCRCYEVHGHQYVLQDSSAKAEAVQA